MALHLNYFLGIYVDASLIFIYLLLILFSNCLFMLSDSIGDQLIPQICMELSDELAEENSPLLASFRGSQTWMLILGICWQLLDLLISIMQIGSDLIRVLICYTISSGFWRKYHVLKLDNLRYLAIVVDSEEAKNITKLKQLLQWLSAIGVNHVILYDMEGVLKNSMDNLLENSPNSGTTSCFDSDIKSLLHQDRITLELLAFSDCKEGTAKAASILCSKHLKGDTGFGNNGLIFTETDMAHALKIVGCGGPEPDLLLIFGPARCHLGFPAWRIRYTEIVHMGRLKSLKYGAILKAIHNFSKKHQNYGS